MEDDGAAEEEVLKPEAGSDAVEVEQVLVLAVVLEGHLLSRGGSQSVLRGVRRPLGGGLGYGLVETSRTLTGDL